MDRTLAYCGAPLDRVAYRRKDGAWLAAKCEDPSTRVVPIWRDFNCVRDGDAPTAVTLSGAAARRALDMAQEWALLGLDGDGTAWIACDVSAANRSELTELVDGAAFLHLRKVGARLARNEGALLAQARGLLHWHSRHRFCSVCGAPSAAAEGGYSRRCTDAACAAQHFPRTDPTVIMLVTRSGRDGDACLLGRHQGWPENRFSTLAGFVEPGETLEEAVAREIAEETGLRVGALHYFGSQPWPFPASVMVGFHADLDGPDTVRVDQDELAEAHWFSRDDLQGRGARAVHLPGGDSIARALIDCWLAGEAPASVTRVLA